MSDTVDGLSLTELLADAHGIVDALQAVALARGTDAELLDGLRELERLRRRLDSVDYRLINETSERRLPNQYGCRTTGRFLRHLLRIDPAEANARVRAAEAAGPRRALTGEALPAIFEHVAAAQQAGEISQRHALLIEKTIDELPDAVQAEHGEEAERDLVGYAHDFDPQRLSVLARKMSDCLNPDGIHDEPDEQQRRRTFSVRVRANGASHVEGELTAEATERLLTCFDTFAAPRPANEHGVKDPRAVGQRQHDALLDLLELAQRSAEAPSNNGVSMTIVVTMTLEQYLSGQGLARTAHGSLVSVADALTWSGGDAEVLAVAMNSVRAITHYGHAHRIFTEKQRLVMAARDGGCTFPGCPEPPGRCQTDHVTRWEHGGPTAVDNGSLQCRYHHREAERLGYRAIMIDGIPYWVPPRWIDRQQRPVRNTLHDTVPAA